MSTVANSLNIGMYADGIRNQLSEGSCKAFQMTGATQLMSRLAGIDLPDFSPQQVYNDTRIKQGTFNVDTGSYTSSAEHVAKNIGFAKESSFTYGTHNLYTIPSAEVHAEAGQFKITNFTHTAIEKSDVTITKYMQEMLSQGKPILVDAWVHNGFGVDPNQFLNPLNGGHAYLITGYNNTTQMYTVMNSWGSTWAGDGFGEIKYSDLPGIGPTSGGPFGKPYMDLLGLSTIDGWTSNGETINLVWTASRMEVARYYSTILDRAAEVDGLDFWASFDGVMSNTDMANNMIMSSEGQALYSHMSNGDFVEAMYENVMGRHSDEGGYNLFVGMLNDGASRGQVISGVIDYLAVTKTDMNDYSYLYNKTNLSTYTSIALQYQGGNDAATALALDGVTSDANGLEIIKIGLHETLYVNLV